VSHRVRVLAAVERFARRHAPRRVWPIDARSSWVVVAGTDLACLNCGAGGRAPLPTVSGYRAAVEAFLALHRDCPGAAA
jgi:hypothetical protein